MKKHIIYLISSVSVFSFAVENDLAKLPTENFKFEIIDTHQSERLFKGEFETSSEFEERQKAMPKPLPLSLFVEKSLRYDADLETYSLSCFDEAISLKNDTTLVPKIGKNSFGATWEWNEKQGEYYEITFPCPDAHFASIKVPLKQAKKYRNDFVAVIELELIAQSWTSDKHYETPEFGKSFIDNYYIYSKEASVKAVHFGLKSNREIYKSKYPVAIDARTEFANNPIIRIEPKYPVQASRDGKEGWVRLSFTINEFGGVEDIDVIDAEPQRVFDREAKRALRKWKYKPQIVDGIPVKMTGMTVQLDFNLDK